MDHHLERPRPKILAIEEDHEEEEEDDDVIPGPSPQMRVIRRNLSKSHHSHNTDMDASLTEHHFKGRGILASRRDVTMDPQDFATGCILLQAAARGDLAAISKIITPDPKYVNFRDYDRRTALHIASSEGHLVIVEFLVENGARINRSDRWGGSPLDDAHRHQQSHIVKYLRSNGGTTGSVNQTVNLISAASTGDTDEVLMLIDAVPDLDEGDYDKRTALHLASGEGHIDIVKVLCKAGANPNAEDRWGGRPLDDALQSKHRDVIDLLKSYGAHSGASRSHVSHSSDEMFEEGGLQINYDSLEIIERIGAGAFGEIYKCRWRGTLVAAKIIKATQIRKEWVRKNALAEIANGKGDVDDLVKVLDDVEAEAVSDGDRDAAVDDFRKEIAVLKSLRHPNICLLLAYSTTQEKEIMVSELMKCSLLDVFKSHTIQNTKMSYKQKISYAQQLARGMLFLHTCRPVVIHRDLKPANLLVDNANTLKISDFGLAKVRSEKIDPTHPEAYTMTGETGSYRFMAPEVYKYENYNETVDVYSFAMILFYLMDGKPPWPHLNGAVAVKKAALQADRPVVPRTWDEKISHLMKESWHEEPNLRPSFETILRALDLYMKNKFKIDEGGAPVKPTTEQGCSCTIQ